MKSKMRNKWFEEYLENEVSCPECGSVVEVSGDEKYVYCEICDAEVLSDIIRRF